MGRFECKRWSMDASNAQAFENAQNAMKLEYTSPIHARKQPIPADDSLVPKKINAISMGSLRMLTKTVRLTPSLGSGWTLRNDLDKMATVQMLNTERPSPSKIPQSP